MIVWAISLVFLQKRRSAVRTSCKKKRWYNYEVRAISCLCVYYHGHISMGRGQYGYGYGAAVAVMVGGDIVCFCVVCCVLCVLACGLVVCLWR